MGVTFSTSIGFGIAWEEDKGPKVLNDLKLDESEINDWLEENGYDRLGSCICGDWMGGPEVGFIYVRGSEMLHHDAREYSAGSPITVFDESVDDMGHAQLMGLVNRIGWDGHAGWLLIDNVG
jgi:hypothetical protein